MGPTGSEPQIESGGEPVILGIDRFLASTGAFFEPRRSSPRIALLTNAQARAGLSPSSAPGPEAEPTYIALARTGLPMSRIFTPEHGLSGTAPDGAPVDDSRESRTGLPVTSLYGGSLRPEPETLADADLLLVDLQDVGARFYTFLWTISHVMEAAAEAGIPVVVLDRPNPVGGAPEWVEGPLPTPDSARHFLGRWPIPVRHSLTLGEMALLLKGEMEVPVQVDVVPMEGWRRSMLWRDTGLPFHPPSPGIASPESALLYPAMVFLEATNVSMGRGTKLPFQWLGASWLDAELLADALNACGPPGVGARPLEQTLPGTSHPCPGVRLDITDPKSLRPVALGLRLLALLAALSPRAFRWTPYPTNVHPTGADHLVRLLGRQDVADRLVEDPRSVDGEVVEAWTEAQGWWDRAIPYLLYD